MTEEQRDVWWLAREIYEKEAGAIDPATLDEVRSKRVINGNAALDWAISYFSCIPAGRADMLMRAHESGEWLEKNERYLASNVISTFYKALHASKPDLYGTGLRMLGNLR